MTPSKGQKIEPERLNGLQSDAAKKILYDAPTNPALEVLDEIKDEALKLLDQSVTCRTCPSSMWIRKRRELVCYCPNLNAVTWKSTAPTECEIVLCSARQQEQTQTE